MKDKHRGGKDVFHRGLPAHYMLHPFLGPHPSPVADLTRTPSWGTTEQHPKLVQKLPMSVSFSFPCGTRVPRAGIHMAGFRLGSATKQLRVLSQGTSMPQFPLLESEVLGPDLGIKVPWKYETLGFWSERTVANVLFVPHSTLLSGPWDPGKQSQSHLGHSSGEAPCPQRGCGPCLPRRATAFL